MTDADVIRRSLVDGALFGLLFDRHFPAVCRFLRARLGGSLAEDLASEVFLTAFRRRAGYDLARDDARPWLFGIAVNLVREHRRAEVRRLQAYARSAVVDPRPGSAAAWESFDPLLASALLRLRDEDRHLFLLFAWAQLSYEQLAEALEIPVGTVRSRLSRVRAALRSGLELPVPVGVAGEELA